MSIYDTELYCDLFINHDAAFMLVHAASGDMRAHHRYTTYQWGF